MSSHSRPPSSSGSKPSSSRSIDKYQLGDSLGKGAFGQVYRALNWATGETVAVKEIQLSNIPKGELPEIMSEIDLLKNLNHPNIVKYKGFVKEQQYLYIILEFCENGSLHNIIKRFGKFPENLVAVYISQVLEGLVYLHDQGVIHRDIKGANILTNKDGTVKLADFGVASSTTTGGVRDDAVVGSPYWMAPEVIEQSGATTASDIWSVGCLVIELLEGHPPYHFLDPMPALFRIVQDDCPPIPEGASPVVKDFLYRCFQKDCNLRISAKKLLKHPWMSSARKQMGDGKSRANAGDTSTGSESGKRPAGNYNYDEAVLKVQEWNEALKSPSRPSKHPGKNQQRPASPLGHHSIHPPDQLPSLLASTSAMLGHRPADQSQWKLGVTTPNGNANAKSAGIKLVEKIQPLSLGAPEEQTDNWDDDFEEGISFTKLQALEKPLTDDEKPEAEDNAQTIRPTKSPGSNVVPLAKAPPADMNPIVEDYSDIASEEDEFLLEEKMADFKMKNHARKGLFHPDDIKTFGLGPTAPAPLSAPLPNKPSRASLNGLGMGSAASSLRGSHSRASSLAGALNGASAGSIGSSGSGGGSGGGSFGRTADAWKNQGEFDKYAEVDDDDYEDVFGKPNTSTSGPQLQTLQLNTRLSNKSWVDNDSDEEDPFAEFERDFSEDDLETNLQRDKYARLSNSVNQLIDQLTPSAPDFQLRDACDEIMSIIDEAPEMQVQLVSSHGMLAILEVLEGKYSREYTMKLLQIINILVNADLGFLESFCLIGGIPVMMEFTSKKYAPECRLQASNFIRLLCHTSVLTLQMFISCRGLKVLVELLDEHYAEQADLVVHALNGIGSVFELQSPTTKNDFCRMFIREGLLDPLSNALLNVMNGKDETSKEMKMKIIQILQVFAQVTQSDIHVRSAMGTRKVIRRLMRACELLEPECLVQMLKAVKHLSMNATLLEVLQNANALEILIHLLDEQTSGPHSTEMANHIFQTCYNLCRLNKSRQEEAAQAGILPCLKRVIETNSPLKQFALPILCDLAGAGKSCRSILWQHDGLRMYLKLLEDPYFQVLAFESILSWLQDETARIEDELTKPDGIESLLLFFNTAKTNCFENLLDPFLKMMRLSTPITISMSRSSAFFKRIINRLNHDSKPVVHLNLLRILRTVCEVHPNKGMLVAKYELLVVVERLSKKDGAVLVRELAREIVPVLKPGLAPLPKEVNGDASRRNRSGSGSGSGGKSKAGERERERDQPRGKERAEVTENGVLGNDVSTPGGSSGRRRGLAPKKMRRTASEASAIPLGIGTRPLVARGISGSAIGGHRGASVAHTREATQNTSRDWGNDVSFSNGGGGALRDSVRGSGRPREGSVGESPKVSTARYVGAKSRPRQRLGDIPWQSPAIGGGGSSEPIDHRR